MTGPPRTGSENSGHVPDWDLAPALVSVMGNAPLECVLLTQRMTSAFDAWTLHLPASQLPSISWLHKLLYPVFPHVYIFITALCT